MSVESTISQRYTALMFLVIIEDTERTTSAVCLFALELRMDIPVAVLVCEGDWSP